MSFGNKLKTYRKIYNLTQEELAKKLNTTKQVISRYESEQRSPSLSTAIEFSKKLDVPLETLADIKTPSGETGLFLSAREKELLIAYRNNKEIQKQIDLLLNI